MNHENCEMKIRGKIAKLVQSIRINEEDQSWFAVHPGGIQMEDGFLAFPLKHIEIQYLICNFLCASKYRWGVTLKIADGDQHHFGKEIRITKNTLKKPTIFR